MEKLKKSVRPAGPQPLLVLLLIAIGAAVLSLVVNLVQYEAFQLVEHDRDVKLHTVSLLYERIDDLKVQRADLEADLADLDEAWRPIAVYDGCMAQLGYRASSVDVCQAHFLQLYPSLAR